MEPWKIVVCTAGGTIILAYLHQRQRVPLLTRIQSLVFKWARKIPSVKNQIDTELAKIRENFEEEFNKGVEDIPYQVVLPATGQSADDILAETKLHLNTGDFDWENGAMSGCVYNSSKEVTNIEYIVIHKSNDKMLGQQTNWRCVQFVSLDQSSSSRRLPRPQEDGGRGGQDGL